MSIRCSYCNAENPDGSKFCNQCGHSLTPHLVSPSAPQVLPMAQPASGRAVTALVLGIVSLVFVGFVAGIPAMILGKIEKDEIAAGRSPISGESLARIGFWLGFAGTVWSGLMLVIGILLLLRVLGVASLLPFLRHVGNPIS